MRRGALAVTLLALTACASRSPFTRTPADLARDDPCRYMGTFHKESRQRLEELRACGALTLDQWRSLARSLAELDDEFTGRCRQGRVPLSVIEDRQRELYARGAEAPGGETIECSLLSAEDDCMAQVCRQTTPE